MHATYPPIDVRTRNPCLVAPVVSCADAYTTTQSGHRDLTTWRALLPRAKMRHTGSRQCGTSDRSVAWHDSRMNTAHLIASYPRVFHAASAVAWPSIQKHGLLSTVRLLDLFGVDPDERNELLTRTRREPTRLEAPGLPLGFPPR